MIGVVGLGLIGGSIAKALNQNTDYTVYGYDVDDSVTRKAVLVGAIEEALTEKMLPECDMVIVALWPEATVSYISDHASQFKKGALVVDTCGVKKYVCDRIWPLAEEHGFRFIGCHPMAGMEHSGFDHSKRALFDKASMVIVPPKDVSIEDIERLKALCVSIGFTDTRFTTPEEHDRMIAFTSQLAHVVSSAYIKSPLAGSHAGFSAGSYRDLTRVAKLNEDMWTELFLENRDNLADEIDGIVSRLQDYSRAIREGDDADLHEMLKEGRERKAEIDKEYF
ncbi:MAG: prephenate dehydrogenase [Anaerovoracaceae bacterium]|jgi:prephenate dehydrogenase